MSVGGFPQCGPKTWLPKRCPPPLEFNPDLILLDVMMPDMDGGDVAAQIRRDSTLKETPIVFLTAAVKKEELGAPDGVIGGFTYIAKPLNVKGVMSVIEKHLEN